MENNANPLEGGAGNSFNFDGNTEGSDPSNITNPYPSYLPAEPLTPEDNSGFDGNTDLIFRRRCRIVSSAIAHPLQ